MTNISIDDKVYEQKSLSAKEAIKCADEHGLEGSERAQFLLSVLKENTFEATDDYYQPFLDEVKEYLEAGNNPKEVGCDVSFKNDECVLGTSEGVTCEWYNLNCSIEEALTSKGMQELENKRDEIIRNDADDDEESEQFYNNSLERLEDFVDKYFDDASISLDYYDSDRDTIKLNLTVDGYTRSLDYDYTGSDEYSAGIKPDIISDIASYATIKDGCVDDVAEAMELQKGRERIDFFEAHGEEPDANDIIEDYKEDFPINTQKWIEKRLNQYNDRNKGFPDKEDVNNVRDWCNSLEPDFIEKKLSKISWNDAMTLQEEWHKSLENQAPVELQNDITPLMKFDNGWSFVKLNSPESKDFEGSAMGNSVGHDYYDDKTIFSLRDEKNNPHLTIEYDYLIVQIKDNGNTLPKPEYLNMLGDFCTELKPKLIAGIDHVISENGKYYIGRNSILNIPDNVKVKTVNISDNYAISESRKLYYGENSILNIPDDEKLKTANISNTRNITEWHHDVSGDFSAYNSGLERVADGVKIGGNFDARGSELETIGENVDIGGSVDIKGCKNIKEWNCDIRGNFNAPDSGLERIGNNVKIGGNFYAVRSNLESIGDNVEIGEYLRASNSELRTIGDNVKIGDRLLAESSNLRTIGDNVKIGDMLYAPDSKLERIGENVEIGGETDISNTPLERSLKQEPEEESRGMRR